MLEKLPSFVGRALRGVRPGLERTVVHKLFGESRGTIVLSSAAFTSDGPLDRKYTADGEGISPPLEWSSIPIARSLALIVEDADSPTPSPLVHAIIAPIARDRHAIAEGEIRSHTSIGKNSYMKTGWLPPDPPPGHGPHRYVFQLFALSTEPDLGAHPGRSSLVKALEGHVLAHGFTIATYERSGKH